ncbi:MAG: DNA polymerase III subunit gamma/tau [Bauldia sp.]|nr:DNA polymerase III subunit gamma/tau [Bauldia sp.]
MSGAKAGAHRVLARKHRPWSFVDLVGQEPMVRTLTNAFAAGRIAQAYMLTGVRGVGKTTTARILARALNYSVPGKVDRPTVDMPELGEHCAAIMEGRHVDVIEMDAASHTGIGDIREIIEAVRYKPAVARYKVYIIDEVHMLSNAAFNGLLKTLEEPPEHVKFIFATTEIRKVPVTVLSRCQRFDLRRIDAERLIGLLSSVAEKEGLEVERPALALIARAAEGSARDSLSLLDQAGSLGTGTVREADVQLMLGLADRGRVVDLFEALMRGDIAAALKGLAEQHDLGAEPTSILGDLATFTHLVTRMKVAPETAEDPALTELEIRRAREFAGKLSLATLSRAWQMLLKGITEATEASRPRDAADMVLVRIAYAAELPTPDEAVRGAPAGAARPAAASPARPAPSTNGGTARMAASGGGDFRAAPQSAPDSRPAPSEAPQLSTFQDLIALADARRDVALKIALERHVRPILFEPGKIEIALEPGVSPGFAGELGKKLLDWTGRRWVVAVGKASAAPTVHEVKTAARDQLVSDAKTDPLVAAVLAEFPGAEIVDVRMRETVPEAAPAAAEDPDAVED